MFIILPVEPKQSYHMGVGDRREKPSNRLRRRWRRWDNIFDVESFEVLMFLPRCKITNVMVF
jgi:hypothetical protein